MKYNEFNELIDLVDDDVLLIQEANTLALKKVKLSTLKQYIGIASAPSYSNEANAVINAIQATGVVLTTAQKDACNNRIAGMITSGIWVKRIAYYGFLGGTANAHAINWKSPGAYNISWLGSMVHSSNGINSDGSTGYGDTGLTESSFNQASTHISVYSRTSDTIEAHRDVGTIPGDGLQLIIAFGGKSYYRSFYTETGLENGTPASQTGYFIGARNGSNAAMYRNALSYISTNSSANGPGQPGNIAICRASANYTSKQFASVGLGAGLTQAEVTNDFNSEQAYQTALNRQV